MRFPIDLLIQMPRSRRLDSDQTGVLASGGANSTGLSGRAERFSRESYDPTCSCHYSSLVSCFVIVLKSDLSLPGKVGHRTYRQGTSQLVLVEVLVADAFIQIKPLDSVFALSHHVLSHRSSDITRGWDPLRRLPRLRSNLPKRCRRPNRRQHGRQLCLQFIRLLELSGSMRKRELQCI